MVWEWSHTEEAISTARENLENKDRKWLEVVYAEWFTAKNFSDKKYEKGLKEAKKLDTEALIDYIWEKMSELRNCTNGGWEAWACPFGCLCHMISFSPEESEDESL